ncbi:MAG: hypothetical protein HOB18_12880, partial [Nitrospina sp.]|nr:hypothetical protein [Nitrospina sp.]
MFSAYSLCSLYFYSLHPYLLVTIRLSTNGGFRQPAEELVVDELGDGRVVAANGALGVAPGLEGAELAFEGVVHKQLADKGL